MCTGIVEFNLYQLERREMRKKESVLNVIFGLKKTTSLKAVFRFTTLTNPIWYTLETFHA